jgi:hypothetical protein
MKGTLSLQRLKRAAAVAGVSALVVGGAMLGTTQAHAAAGQIGTGTGLTLSPASGGPGSATTTTPTFSASACPSGDNGSATVAVIDPTTPAGTTDPSAINNQQEGATISPANVPFNGTFSTTLQALVGPSAGINIAAGQQFEVAVQCYTDSQGSLGGVYVQSTFVTVNADGSFTANQAFIQPSTPATTTTLTASGPPDYAGQNITLTAKVTGGTSSPAQGSVLFTNGGLTIAGTAGNPNPAPLTNGVATFTTSFAAAGTESLGAAFQSSNTATWATSNGTLSLSVTNAPTNAIPLTVTVPTAGSFILTVGTTTVPLTITTGLTATGTIPNGQVTVNDTRNTYPGWIVSGQDSVWSGPGTPAATFSGDALNWTPTLGTIVASGVTKGAPSTSGLGTTAQELAAAPHGAPNGYGESDLGAGLTLVIPPTAPAGDYMSNLSITAVQSN